LVVTILTVLFVLVCPLLIGVILIQEPKGGGLAGVLGGAGAASPFGAQTAKFVMYSTITLGFLFFALTLVLGITLRSTETAAPSLQDNLPVEAAPLTPASAPASSPASAPAGAPSGATSQPAAPAPAPAAPASSAPAQS
jgi:preprotein translocase subunit SecG